MALTILPNAGQNLAETRQPIRNNFDFINTGFLVNHTGFNEGIASGKHKFLQMPEQGSSPTTAVNEMGLFTRQSPDTGVAEMAVRRESDGIVYEFTAAQLSQSGWTRLPSGLAMVWGFRNNFPAGTTAINLTSANFTNFPGFSSVFVALVTTVETNLALAAREALLTTAVLSVATNAANVRFNFFVLGVTN